MNRHRNRVFLYAAILTVFSLSFLACPNPASPPGPTVSNDARLASLVLSSGTLNPGFAAGTTAYTANIAFGTSEITVTASCACAEASLTINGVANPQGVASAVIPVPAGETVTVTIVVTAENGTTTRTYTVQVTRAAEDAKAITAFSFLRADNPDLPRDYHGVIDEGAHTITVNVRGDTNLNGLKPTMIFVGDTVNPASGVATSFTDGVARTYTVTAADGSPQDYEVTVNLLDLTTVSGTVTLPADDADAPGAETTVSLSNWDNDYSTNLVWNPDNRTATYTFTREVIEGTYTLEIWIDMDGDWELSTGDYYKESEDLAVPETGSVTLDVSLPKLSLATVTGTVTLPDADSEAPGAEDDVRLYNSKNDYSTNLMWNPDNQTAEYTFDGIVAEGTYTLEVLVDKDDNDTASTGDYYGKATGIVVSGTGSVDRDLELSEVSHATVSGTLTIPIANADGMWAYLEFYNSVGMYCESTELQWGAGTTETFSTSILPAGTYYMRVWLDLDDDWLIDEGDYVGWYGGSGIFPPASATLVVPASGTKTDVNVTLAVYPPGTASISGRITIPAGNADGAIGFILVDSLGMHSEEDFPGMVGGVQFVWSGAGTTYDYTISNLPAGTFYVWAAMEMVEDGVLASGDYQGYYGGSGINPPAARNVTVNAGQSVNGIDFILSTVP